MELKIYAVYDMQAQAYLQPFFYPNDGMAVRQIRYNMTIEPKSPFCVHPEDYRLDCVGVFDDSTGMVNQNDVTPIMNLNDIYGTLERH